MKNIKHAFIEYIKFRSEILQNNLYCFNCITFYIKLSKLFTIVELRPLGSAI